MAGWLHLGEQQQAVSVIVKNSLRYLAQWKQGGQCWKWTTFLKIEKIWHANFSPPRSFLLQILVTKEQNLILTTYYLNLPLCLSGQKTKSETNDRHRIMQRIGDKWSAEFGIMLNFLNPSNITLFLLLLLHNNFCSQNKKIAEQH